MTARVTPLVFSVLALAFALAIAVGSQGAIAAAPAAFSASDFAWTSLAGGSTVTVEPGANVVFAYPSGGSAHNARFDTLQPDNCVQTNGMNVGSVPPLPSTPQSAGWSGNCTFNAPGTYKFHCDLHPSMTGTVIVGVAGGAPAEKNSLAGANLSLSPRQKGTRVKGDVTIAEADSDLKIELSSSRELLRRFGVVSVTTGKLVVSNLPTGKTRFLVRLNRKASAALKRRGKLKTKVKVTLTNPSGVAVSRTKSITLRR